MVCKTSALIVGFALRGEKDNEIIGISQYFTNETYLSAAIIPLNPHKLYVFLIGFAFCQSEVDFYIPKSFSPSEKGRFPVTPACFAD